MPPRVVRVEFHQETRLWQATSIVNGSQYCVHGRTVKDVLREFCELLDHPSRRWQVVKTAAGDLLCKELPEINIAELPSTGEIPAYR
jgi:hypothetical protein